MRASEVTFPGIVVGVELHQRDRTELPVYRAQDGQQDRVISADADGTRARIRNFAQLVRYAVVGIVQGERINREVAVIGDAPMRERVDIQHRVPRTNDGALLAHMARTEARPRTVGGATIEWDPNERNIEFLRARNVRQAHEGC